MEKTVSMIASTVKSLRDTFNTHKTFPKEWREGQLKAILNLLENEDSRLEQAVHADVGKCKQEYYMGESSAIKNELKETLHNLHHWMKPTSVSTPMFQLKGLSSSYIQPTPLGVVLIICPWNYPINLVLTPVLGAISAGNCVLIKPSELAPNTSKLLAELIPKYLDNDCIKVIEGGIPETTEILKHQFDHIFYTGNPAVGKIIMRAASEHLTPVTLELGGKNPTFVDSNVDLNVAAKRIIWGKTFNAGQSCISPDYILVKRDFQEKLIAALVKEVQDFFGEDPKDSKDFSRIITTKHVQRLTSYLEDIDSKNVVCGGASKVDIDSKYFPPTIVKNVKSNNKIMEDEIFGPMLPIIPIDSWEEGLQIVHSKGHPLALYVFTKDNNFKNQIQSQTQSGALVINDVMVHVAQSTLPFGGVGMSGMGSYHGKKSFDTFSHMRSVLDKTVWFDLDFRYPPYSDSKFKQTKLFI